ncbi:hypothetical protein PG988_016016 [Apiospora saccharicola]
MSMDALVSVPWGKASGAGGTDPDRSTNSEVVDEGGVVWDGNTPGGELLNAGQSEAVRAALTHPLVSIWGPPGTGKTQTIVEILLGLQQKFPAERILVTAPTHNAVDNVMRRYLSMRGKEGPTALRVSTELRSTVQPVTAALAYDVSLFERLYTSGGGRGGVRTCMLNTQYRMHPVISEFSSREFYGGELRTGISAQGRPLAASAFPWPETKTQGSKDVTRTILIECAGREDLGQKSKRNRGQAELCRRVCQLLLDAPPSSSTAGSADKKPNKQSIAVLTPYAAQMTLLKSTALAGLDGNIEVSSIDGFQGREADIVILVTVRCNERGEIGFLRDLRRMNVALTRARAGLIVLGNRATLTSGAAKALESESEENAAGMLWKRLLESLTRVEVDEAAEMKRERLG